MTFLFLLSLILIFSNIQGQVQPIIDPVIDPPIDPISFCGYGSQALCNQHLSCWWDPTLYCSNKLNCSKIPLNQCAETKFCHLIKPTLGYCYGPPPHCSSYNLKQCIKDPFCYWISSYQCIPKDPMPPFPNCASFNPIQCLKNAEYCNLNSFCYDNKQFCSALNYQQCLQDPACKYLWTQKEQCLNNPKYCAALNEQDCLKNKFCLGQYTAPKCENTIKCSELNYDQCLANSAYCVIFQVAGAFQCQNSFNCNSITDPDECKLNRLCSYIPSQFQCFSNYQNCPQLQGVDCQNNPACIYIPAKGYCTQSTSFGCNSLSAIDCLNNKHCLLKYSCTPKKLPNCNLLSLDQCKKSKYCQLIDKGKCYDKKYNCNLPYKQCIYTIPCVWHPGTNGKCVNDFECAGLSQVDCNKNDVYCKLTVGGCKLKTK